MVSRLGEAVGADGVVMDVMDAMVGGTVTVGSPDGTKVVGRPVVGANVVVGAIQGAYVRLSTRSSETGVRLGASLGALLGASEG
jgi:hypothetical protein